MSNSRLPARYTAFHAAGGAVLNSALGAAWALLGILALRPVGMPWAAIAVGLATGVLLVLSFRAVQRAGTVDDEEMLPEAAAERSRRGTLSHRVLRIEGLAITAVSAALVVTQNHAYIAPATALIVGLHYLALAPIHRTLGDGVAGALIVALSVATILWVPRIPSVHQNAMNIAAGFGTAAVLWGTAVAILVTTPSSE
ncbi:MAG: hypothetical protein ACYCYF_05880 [Anaerolineae bacterium]